MNTTGPDHGNQLYLNTQDGRFQDRALAWGVGDFNASLRKIAMVDLLGIVFLVAAVALKLVAPGR